MQLYRRGDVWWIRDGSVRKSTGCKDKAAAQRKALEFERERTDPRFFKAQRTTLSDAIRLTYQEIARRGRSQATQLKLRQKLGHFPRLWGADMRMSAVTAALVDEYIDLRSADGVKRITIRDELAALRQLLKISAREGVWNGVPAEILPLRFDSGHVPRDRWLTRDQAWKLVHGLPERRGAMVAFILASGARYGEAVRAQRQDVDLVRGEMLIRGTKTELALGKVPVTPLTEAFIRYALDHAPGGIGEELFDPWDNPVRDVASMAEKLGLPVTSPNDWRRSCAKWHRLAGVPTPLIANMLRHSTDKLVQTTYAKLEGVDLGEALRITVPSMYKPSPNGGSCQTVLPLVCDGGSTGYRCPRADSNCRDTL